MHYPSTAITMQSTLFQTVQNKFLRLALPTAKHASTDLLHILADIPPVKFHSWQLRLKLIIKAIASPDYHHWINSEPKFKDWTPQLQIDSVKSPFLSIANDELFKSAHWEYPQSSLANLLSNIYPNDPIPAEQPQIWPVQTKTKTKPTLQ